MGALMGVIGPLVPALRADLSLTYAQAGLLLSAQSVGNLLVLSSGGWLVHLLGKRRLLLGGSLALAAGLGASAAAADWVSLMAFNLIMGCGMSLLDVGISTLVMDAHSHGKGRALNRLHGFFGVGAVLGPLIALGLAGVPGGWRWAFAGLGAAGLGLVGAAWAARLPADAASGPGPTIDVYRRPFLWLGALALFVYCGVEWGIGAWFPSFWTAVPGVGSLDPALATSLFWLTFAVGRLTVGPWADRWGLGRFLAVTIAATLVLSALWVAFPQPLPSLAWVLLLGFVIAGQYPTFAALLSQRFPQASGQVTSFLSLFGAFGTFLWTPAIGLWADTRGIAALPWAVAALALLLLAATGLALAVGRRRA